MKKQLLCLIMIANAFAAFGQNWSKKADKLYSDKEYSQAAKMYDVAADSTHFVKLKQIAYYNGACSYALAGDKEKAFDRLNLAIKAGYHNKTNMLTDSDLKSLHQLPQWDKLVKSIKERITSSPDPLKARLITSDVENFWETYDKAITDSANKLAIYQKYYLDKASPGLQDYYINKIRNLQKLVRGHNVRKKFLASIRENTMKVESQKVAMVAILVKFKELYPQAMYPDIYFVIGDFSSGGTVSEEGLLIGLDMQVDGPEVVKDELSLWQRNNLRKLEGLPNLIAHELIHFQQNNMASDTTLLKGVMVEGMADFMGELISGNTANDRLLRYTNGREKQIWADFKKEMYLNRSYNWIANANQETEQKPADLGYWVGYRICKAYYERASDKKQAIYDLLHLKDYKKLYEDSRVEETL